MPDERLNEMFRQHQVGKVKYTYFLLAVSASAVAYAVEKTEGLALSADFSMLVVAALCWGSGFYFGCRNIEWGLELLLRNATFHRLQAGMELASQDMQVARKERAYGFKRAQHHATWQLRMLILGAAFFIIWHGWRLSMNVIG